MSDPIFLVRKGRPSDLSFVRDAWLESDKSSPAGRDAGRSYYREAKIKIAAILDRPNTELRIAHVPDDDDAILGWAVVGSENEAVPVVYYVYVRRDARQNGIAKSLLADLVNETCEYTHKPVIRARLPIPQSWTYSVARNYRR